MALTNSEKSTLRWAVKDCIRKGVSEKDTIEKLRGNFKIATIKNYYKTELKLWANSYKEEQQGRFTTNL